jgi:hypothetical protein
LPVSGRITALDGHKTEKPSEPGATGIRDRRISKQGILPGRSV